LCHFSLPILISAFKLILTYAKRNSCAKKHLSK
jgi:hypothetical protein